MSFPRPERVRPLTLHTVADLLGDGARLTHGDPATEVTGVALDTKTLQPGDLWAALPGARAHGADFVDKAVAAGAVAVITDADRAKASAAAFGAPPFSGQAKRMMAPDAVARPIIASSESGSPRMTQAARPVSVGDAPRITG